MEKNRKILWIVGWVIFALLMALLTKWYWDTYVFVDNRAYLQDAQQIDLRGKEVTVAHYEAVKAAVPASQVLWDVPFQGNYLSEESKTVTVTSLTEEDMGLLDYFPQLQILDARGCTDYPLLEAFQASHPQVQVLYTVTIDGTDYAQDAKHLDFTRITQEEVELLRYLPQMKSVDAQGSVDYDLILEIRSRYPDWSVDYSVVIGGESWPWDTEALDLDGADAGELMAKLPYLTQLKQVSLTNPDCDAVTMPQLLEACPEVEFFWQMDILGRTVTWEDTQLDFSGIAMEEMELVEIRLKNFPNLERVFFGRRDKWDDCLLMEAYRSRVAEEYKVVWSILMGAVVANTDDTWFMPGKFGKGLTESQSDFLRFCVDMVCIDVGHKPLDSCEWVEYMPNLRYLILADTNIEDLTPLSTCKNLVFLELFMSFAKDYTPLLGCTALEDLNIGSTWGDPEPLKQMTWLKRLWWPGHEKYMEEFKEALPNTQIYFYSLDSDTAGGWRLGEHYYAQRDYMGVPYMGG